MEYRRDWMILVPGVVPALSAVLRAMTHPSEGVILLTPVYNCFFSSVRNMGCRTEECALRRQGDTFVGPNLLGRLLMELRDNGTLSYRLPDDALSAIRGCLDA